MKFLVIIIILMLFGGGFFLFRQGFLGQEEAASPEEFIMGELTLKSSVFENNGEIPAKYTCDGDDINPPLSIEGVPEGTKSLALVVDDPDAPMGVFDHWIVWNISPQIREIPAGSVPSGAIEGETSFGKQEYGGPCPPSGIHRYQFKLYALDAGLDLDSSSKKEDLEKAMEGHILAQTLLVGTYQRQ